MDETKITVTISAPHGTNREVLIAAAERAAVLTEQATWAVGTVLNAGETVETTLSPSSFGGSFEFTLDELRQPFNG